MRIGSVTPGGTIVWRTEQNRARSGAVYRAVAGGAIPPTAPGWKAITGYAQDIAVAEVR